jgi:hypothetical protein
MKGEILIATDFIQEDISIDLISEVIDAKNIK